MFETMAGFVMGDHMGGLTYEPPLDRGGYARHLSRDRRPYKTSDGYICVIVYNDKQWENFFDATGRNDLRHDPKFATFAGRAVNIDTVYAELARIFQTRTTAEWSELLEKADVPVMPMHNLESILQDPHLVATKFFPVVDHPTEGPIRNMRVSATWSETSVEPTRLAPRLNEHGSEILREAGFSADEIAAMVRDGVTKATPGTPGD
jgi:formyl-CoA transferase